MGYLYLNFLAEKKLNDVLKNATQEFGGMFESLKIRRQIMCRPQMKSLSGVFPRDFPHKDWGAAHNLKSKTQGNRLLEISDSPSLAKVKDVALAKNKFFSLSPDAVAARTAAAKKKDAELAAPLKREQSADGGPAGVVAPAEPLTPNRRAQHGIVNLTEQANAMDDGAPPKQEQHQHKLQQQLRIRPVMLHPRMTGLIGSVTGLIESN